MKKIKVTLICIIIALITGIIGFFIGLYARENSTNNQNFSESSNQDKQNAVVGTYYAPNWNGHEATLILNNDGTCKYPTGDTGKWNTDGEKVYITLDYSDEILNFYNSIGEEYSSNIENITSLKDTHDAIIVNFEIILHDKFFQKNELK